MSNREAKTPAEREELGIDDVIDRLAEKYPGVDRRRIREIVGEEHHAFDGRPVRDFVPVLVEKSSMKRLKALVRA